MFIHKKGSHSCFHPDFVIGIVSHDALAAMLCGLNLIFFFVSMCKYVFYIFNWNNIYFLQNYYKKNMIHKKIQVIFRKITFADGRHLNFNLRKITFADRRRYISIFYKIHLWLPLALITKPHQRG